MPGTGRRVESLLFMLGIIAVPPVSEAVDALALHVDHPIEAHPGTGAAQLAGAKVQRKAGVGDLDREHHLLWRHMWLSTLMIRALASGRASAGSVSFSRAEEPREYWILLAAALLFLAFIWVPLLMRAFDR